MKRAALSSAILLILVFPSFQSPAAAAAVPEVWTGERTITTPVELDSGTSLEIAAGAKVLFDVPATMPPDPQNSTPSLTVEGGLLVNGTALCLTSFRADERVNGTFHDHAYLYIIGNGMPGQFLVQNCTFRDTDFFVSDAAGELVDCAFVDCVVKMYDTPAVVRNCTFYNSYLSVRTLSSENVTLVSGCQFEEDLGFPDADSAIYGYGNVRIEYSRFSGYFWPIYSTDGLLEMTGCHVSGAFGYGGIFLDRGSTGARPSIPIIRDTVVENCGMSGIFAGESVRIINCTLNGSEYGVSASNLGSNNPIELAMEGNRIFNNSEYGIQCGYSADVGVSGMDSTTFDDGHGLTNGKGRLVNWTWLHLTPKDQWGSVLHNVSLCWTDSAGGFGDETENGTHSVIFTIYLITNHIDNLGVPRDHLPVTFQAEKDGVTCRTTLDKPMRSIVMVLQIPPKKDLALQNISTVPGKPKAWDYITFNVTVTCAGEAAPATALLLVDGREDQEQSLGLIPANGSRTFIIGGNNVREGRHRVEVRLDPRNEVHETDEGNNNLTVEFVVAPQQSTQGDGEAWRTSMLMTILVVAVALLLLWSYWRARNKPGRSGKTDPTGDQDVILLPSTPPAPKP